MKRTAILIAVLAVSVLAGSSVSAEESAWMDTDNCDICRTMSSEPGLLEHLNWESYEISNGMMMIARVHPNYEQAYQRAHAAMERVIARMQSGEGEETHLCGFCAGMGALMQQGARSEDIETEAGHITLVTSTDEAVVEKIHAHVRRTHEETERMMAAQDSYGRGSD